MRFATLEKLSFAFAVATILLLALDAPQVLLLVVSVTGVSLFAITVDRRMRSPEDRERH